MGALFPRRRDPPDILVNARYIMTEVGKAGAGYEADHRDAQSPVRPSSRIGAAWRCGCAFERIHRRLVCTPAHTRKPPAPEQPKHERAIKHAAK